jgi:hypothetical protein
MTSDGTRSEPLTRAFDTRSRRTGVGEGPIDILSTHMDCGFTPISGAFFRRSALDDSGFVDEDMYGCVPFENNIFVRLGERGARGWFDPRRLLAFRSHDQQMQKTDYLNNQDYVRLTIRLFERRRFRGRNEWRRRQALGRLHRIAALQKAQAGDRPAARTEAASALRANPASISTWLAAATLFVAPFLLRKPSAPRPEGPARPPDAHPAGR